MMREDREEDSIFLRDLEIETVIGIWEWERRIRQQVRIDLRMGADIPRAAAGDRIEDTLNYKAVAKRVQEFVGDSSFQLVETLAEKVAALVLDEFAVPWIRVTVSKPGAIRGARDVGGLHSPLPGRRRGVTRVFLGIGSNIEPEANLRLAVAELRRRFGEVRLSRVYRGAAIGFDGPDFLNLAAEVDTDRTRGRILAEIEAIHRLARRGRGGGKFTSRTLDIDLLLYDGLIVSEPGAELPRPDVLEYAFVLRPLSELAPDFLHPLTGRPLSGHWREFDAASQPLWPADIDLDEAGPTSRRYARRRLR